MEVEEEGGVQASSLLRGLRQASLILRLVLCQVFRTSLSLHAVLPYSHSYSYTFDLSVHHGIFISDLSLIQFMLSLITSCFEMHDFIVSWQTRGRRNGPGSIAYRGHATKTSFALYMYTQMK